MRKSNRLNVVIKLGAVLAAVAVTTAASSPLWELSQSLALTAAGLQITATQPQESIASIVSQLSQQSASSPQPSSETESAPQSAEHPIVRRTMAASASDTVYGLVALSNHTAEHTVNLASVLATKPALDLVLNGRPQVLIIHTHTSECYMTRQADAYDPDYGGTSSDPDIGVVAVGEAIAAALSAAGINVIHEKTVFDRDFSSSYENAAARIKQILQKYSSIETVLDVHRDSITSDSGTKTAPVVEIDGKNAAQVMILTGCNEAGALSFPSWEYNLRTAVHLQKAISDLYPGLARPIYFTPRRYNMQLTKNSLLIEVGSEVNTLDEALYAAELFGKALVKMLKSV